MISRRLIPPKQGSAFLFGPRMTGKSTWLRQHFEKWHWVDLIHENDFQIYLSDPGRLRKEIESYRQNGKFLGVVIDEVQRVPALLNEVHSLIEEKKIRFILSGSSARKLKRGGANMLAGRAIGLKMFPLTISEMNENFQMDEVLRYGSLPKVFSVGRAEKKQILRAYVGSYLREEIQAEGLVRNLPAFSRFLTLAAETSGQEVNYSEISNDTGVKSKTIKEYYSILEDTLVGHLLLPWQKTARKQLAGSPKFYLFDNGVTNALRESLDGSFSPEFRGTLFEQWVINEIRAELSYQDFEGSLYFWRVRGGSEVDLIIAKGSAPVAAIEIKWTANPSRKHFAGLKSFAEEYPKVPLYLVCNTVRPFVEKGIFVTNAKMFLKDLNLNKLL